MVVVHGYDFADTEALFCRFGDNTSAISPARYIDFVRVECEAPPHAVGEVSVELTTNGVDYTSNGVLFKYLPEVEVTSVTPAAGVVSGPAAAKVHVRVNAMRILPQPKRTRAVDVTTAVTSTTKREPPDFRYEEVTHGKG